MGKYDFAEIGKYYEEIVKSGTFVAHESNWDLWATEKTVYAIPVADSGAKPSFWCQIKDLRAHLHRLRQICGGENLIPDFWENVNNDFLQSYGIY